MDDDNPEHIKRSITLSSHQTSRVLNTAQWRLPDTWIYDR